MRKLISIIFLSSILFAAPVKKTLAGDFNFYKDYVNYLIHNKYVELKDINKMLNSKDKKITLYESLIKCSYDIYKNKEISKETLYRLKLLNKYFNMNNSYEALLLMDMNYAADLTPKNYIKSEEFCMVQFKKEDLQDICKKEFSYTKFLKTKNPEDLIMYEGDKNVFVEFLK